MQIPYIDEKLNNIIDFHESNDPYKIAKEKNIIILEEDLGDIYGYYHRIKRIQFIHINSAIDDLNKQYVCAHELGHAICHPNENTPQLSANSITSELKIEKEADYFATNLLVKNLHEELYRPTKYQILDYYGLPWYLDRYLNL